MWDNAGDHEGFVLAGCPGLYDDKPAMAPQPIPMGNSAYIERFLEARAETIALLARRIQEIPLYAPAGMPAVQAASCMLRDCVPQRSVHLLRILRSSATAKFTADVDTATLTAATQLLDLPVLEKWQEEALYLPAERGGWGLWSLRERRDAARIGGSSPPRRRRRSSAATRCARPPSGRWTTSCSRCRTSGTSTR